ncbi:MAG TPA: hypothetical protein VMY06_12230 [Sedimentisphaerales bacterium]|nr:hypothetical protein [Sedimentisphaerales bacterium]
MEARDRKFAGSVFSTGSALILTVVLTSMLAIIGVLFVMMARVNKVATSAISENRELDLAVETVIAKISQELVSDIPGVVAGQEYYDYPDPCNAWLASLEPYVNIINGKYEWRQINDVTGFLKWKSFGAQNVLVELPFLQRPDPGQTEKFIRDYPEIRVDKDGNFLNIVDGSLAIDGLWSDADGDGVADSKWIILADMTSSKGEPIYAAVRIVDNQAMLNVNTGFKFNPNFVDVNLIDGSSQLQINLMALSWRPGVTVYDPCDEIDLLEARANPGLGLNPLDLYQYEQDVIWRYYRPSGPYTPFDIGDDLELRNRFLVNHEDIHTRIEDGTNLWTWSFNSPRELNTPVVGGINNWFYRAQHDVPGPNNVYSYRHIGTTYNMDRIIDPYGDKMININREIDANTIYDRLLLSNQPLIADAFTRRQYAQLAANMVDFIDEDALVTIFAPNDLNPNIYYGFDAQPFISEIGIVLRSTSGPPDKSKPPIPMNPDDSSFAVELYNPFDCDIPLSDFELELYDRRTSTFRPPILLGSGVIVANGGCVVISNRPLDFGLNPANLNVIVRPELVLFTEQDKSKPPVPSGFPGDTYDVFLKRRVEDVNGTMIYVDYVDKQDVYRYLPSSSSGLTTLHLGRCIRDWHVVYQTPDLAVPSLGWPDPCVKPPSSQPHEFSFFMPNPILPDVNFITVGDIPRILTLGHGPWPNSSIGEQLKGISQVFLPQDREKQLRLDLQNPLHKNVFQYLTVFDPNSDNIDNDADGLIDAADTISPEVQIPGRININTAPWYVIGQLPWVSARTPNYELARAIVAYRDKTSLPGGPDYTLRLGAPGFESIGELNFVTALPVVPDYSYSIGQYSFDPCDLGTEFPLHSGFPDLTTDGRGRGDGVPNDFEERDVIFSRISNLVTVRSDVFTAYILVRIGADGPQKRVVAILDRSGVNKTNVGSPYGKVRIVALHYVPDPR